MPNENERGLAARILDLVGGKENINGASYCMTRLRLTLADITKADTAQLRATAGVLGVVESAGQLQVILGPGVVNKVAAEFAAIAGITLGEVQDIKATYADRNRTPFKLFLRKLAGIFIPLIPAIVASGMVAGLTNLAIRGGADPQGTLVLLLNAMGWGIFGYLAIFVGINTAREFGGTPAMGGLAAVLLINPAIANIKIWDQALVPGRGGLVGVLLVAWFMTVIEKRLRRYVPDVIDIIVTPTLSLLITGFAAYYVLQPVGGWLSESIVWFFKSLIHIGGPIGGFVLASTFLPVVMSGLHQGLVPVHMEFLNTLKENPLLPILAMAGGGQVGATMAVYLKTKNTRLKNVIKGSLPVGILGIGEPLIFGVTLPLGRPFVTACIGAGFGGAWQAMTHVSTVALGVSGLPLAFLVTPGSVVNYLIGILIAYGGGFAVTWIAGFDDPKDEG